MPPTSKQIKKRGDNQLSTNLSAHKVLLLNDITVIISLPPMNYSPHRGFTRSAPLQTLTFSISKHKRNWLLLVSFSLH